MSPGKRAGPRPAAPSPSLIGPGQVRRECRENISQRSEDCAAPAASSWRRRLACAETPRWRRPRRVGESRRFRVRPARAVGQTKIRAAGREPSPVHAIARAGPSRRRPVAARESRILRRRDIPRESPGPELRLRPRGASAKMTCAQFARSLPRRGKSTRSLCPPSSRPRYGQPSSRDGPARFVRPFHDVDITGTETMRRRPARRREIAGTPRGPSRRRTGQGSS